MNMGPTRIDGRVGEAKAQGLRNVHYDTDGQIIGAVSPAGMPMGSRKRQGQADGSSIGNPVTPGLDRWRNMNPMAPVSAPKMPAPVTPSMIAAPKAQTAPVPQIALTRPKAAVPPANPPRTAGQQLATDNMAKMGVMGAIADYRKRAAAEPVRPPVVPSKRGGLEGTIADLGKARESTLAAAAPRPKAPVATMAKPAPSVVTMASPPPSPASTPPAAPVAPPAATRTPAPMPTLPKPNDSTAYWVGKGMKQALNNTGSMIKQGASAVRESMRGRDYSKPENAPAFTNAMVAKPIQLNSFKTPELSEGAKRIARPVRQGARNFMAGFTGY